MSNIREGRLIDRVLGYLPDERIRQEAEKLAATVNTFHLSSVTSKPEYAGVSDPTNPSAATLWIVHNNGVYRAAKQEMEQRVLRRADREMIENEAYRLIRKKVLDFQDLPVEQRQHDPESWRNVRLSMRKRRRSKEPNIKRLLP